MKCRSPSVRRVQSCVGGWVRAWRQGRGGRGEQAAGVRAACASEPTALRPPTDDGCCAILPPAPAPLRRRTLRSCARSSSSAVQKDASAFLYISNTCGWSEVGRRSGEGGGRVRGASGRGRARAKTSHAPRDHRTPPAQTAAACPRKRGAPRAPPRCATPQARRTFSYLMGNSTKRFRLDVSSGSGASSPASSRFCSAGGRACGRGGARGEAAAGRAARTHDSCCQLAGGALPNGRAPKPGVGAPWRRRRGRAWSRGQHMRRAGALRAPPAPPVAA
jgi:hypothetical protein